MKKLKEHIWYERRTTIRAVAKSIGYTPEHLCAVLNKKTKCGKRLANRLSEWSEGVFSVKEILSM